MVAVLPAVGWALSQAWDAWRARHTKKAEAIDAAIEKATDAVHKLTMALTEAKAELRAQLHILTERTDAIPKIKDDLNALGGKVREHAVLLKGGAK